MLTVALMVDCPERAATLAELFAAHPTLSVVAAGSLDSALLDRLAGTPPDVIVLDPPACPASLQRALERVRAALPNTRLVVTSLEQDHNHIREIWAASLEAFVPQKRLFREPEEALAAWPG
jgi:DNA-binding NarL/FixJ family response regulator